jgi:hypothetical protein
MARFRIPAVTGFTTFLAALIDTGQQRLGSFCAFEMRHPDLDSDERARITGKRGVEFELVCWVYRLVESDYNLKV